MKWVVTSPRVAALHILASRASHAAVVEPSCVPLAEFQREAVARATAILNQRNGVLIADSVGLGKTFVALALIEAAVIRNERVLVVVPAALRRMWRRELRRIGGDVVVASHTQLALHAPPGVFQLVVVDEAHAFRNPQTRRHRALRLVCRAARVVLVTATPVNNSISDLYFQLRLFCSDSAFRDLGIGSLRAVLRDRAGASPSDLARLRHAVTVRRTRAEVRASAPTDLRFPRHVATHVVGFDLPQSTSSLREILGRLSFAPYRSEQGTMFSPDLMRFAFLKRMESSLHALRTTLQRQIRFYEEFTASLERGLLVRPRSFRALYEPSEEALQLVLEGIALESAAGVGPDLLEDARLDLQILRQWHDDLRRTTDDKVRKLIALLCSRPDHAKTIVFTEYRDTALYLWRSLVRRFPTGLIHGSAAWIGETGSTRREVIERFSPASNGGRRVHPRETVRVLVATDVLAEGMNLQDADAVVSYDLPWNPVRLIQRAGRVDRIGSEHDVVHVYNFIPDREFDALLGLARTIRTKLETVRATVGLERPVLEPEEDFEAIARAIAGNQPGLLDRLEADAIPAETAFELPPPVDGIPIARLAGLQPPRILIGLARGALTECVMIDEAGRPDLTTSPEELIRLALADECVRPIAIESYSSFVRDWLGGLSRSGMGAKSAPARLARRIREGLARLAIEEATPELYALADDVLRCLGTRLSAAEEDALEVLCRTSSYALRELLGGIQKTLCDAGNQAASDPAWRVTGVLISD